MRKFYYHYKYHIKKMYWEHTKTIAITQDAWSSPNNVAFVLLTAHFITDKWGLMDITLGIAEIKGEHVVNKSIQMDLTDK